MSNERIAEEFLRNPPHAFCNPEHHPYPSPWDEDKLFRWTREYDKQDLGILFARKTGTELGAIQELIVMHRSPSGRITILNVRGDKGKTTLYGELEIRRALSDSHLPSSYFIVTHSQKSIVLFRRRLGARCRPLPARRSRDGQRRLEHGKDSRALLSEHDTRKFVKTL
ncbi:MAG: hypothetical protein IPP40_12245 [bacterium]|nr:hypothetical protein [bacterium]